MAFLIRKLYILFILISFGCFSQKQKTDSLQYYYTKGKTFFYSNQDSVYKYYNHAKRIAKNTNNIEYLLTLNIYESWCANYFYNYSKMKENITSLNNIFNKYQKDIPHKNYYLSQIYYTKGLYNYEIFKPNTATKHFKQALNYYNKSNDANIKDALKKTYIECNNFLGKLADDEQKHFLSKEYYEENIRFLKKKKLNRQLINTLSLLANNYRLNDSVSKAVKTTKKILSSIKKNSKPNTNRLISLYSNLVDDYINLSKVDSAKYYLSFLKKSLPENHTFLYRYNLSKSKIYETENNYKLAEKELKTVLELKLQQWKNKANYEIAEIYYKLGNLHLKFNHYKNAIDNYNITLKQLSILPKTTLNRVLEFKVLKQISYTELFINKPKNSLRFTQNAINVLDSLKPSFKTTKDKLFLIENAFTVFENGIKACFELHNKTFDKTYINTAFTFIEKSRSTLLLESLLATKATNFVNIPDELTEREQQLKAQITQLEKKINRSPTDQLKNELFEANQNSIELIKNIETNYPSYYNLKYNNKVTSLKEIQKSLSKKQAVITFFYGNKAIYKIVIFNDNTQIYKTPINEELETIISDYQKKIGNPETKIDDLKTTANKLFLNFLEPIKNLNSKTELTIFPDGLLNYIPFGSLVDNNNQYLIESKTIRYSNSATLLSELNQKNSTNNLLAFAPSFKGETIDVTNRSKLLPLPHNAKEVRKIATYFKTKAFVKNQATLQNFIKNEQNFSMLHLATHAVFDDKNPEYSYLAFTAEKNKDNLLYVSDIYNTKLNVDLVTLSACETGIGDLKRGEGFIGLSRSFYYAGAKSLASTLWKINDASTATLMDDFYKNLSEGKDKAKALQQAKIKFLNENKDNALAHPYYWSGFILSGNNQPLTSANYWLYILGGFIMVTLLFFLFRRKSA